MKSAIRSRFVRYSLIIVLPLLVVGAALLYQYYRDKQSDIRLSVLAQARSASQLTTLWLSAQIDSLEAITITRAARTRDLPVLKAYFTRLIKGRSAWTNIVMTDKDGRVLVSYLPSRPGMSLADRDYFIQAKRTGRPYVSNLIVNGRFTGQSVAAIGYPVKDDNGNFTGLMALALRPEGLSDIFSRLMLPQGYVISVFDRQGVLVGRNIDMRKYLGRRYTGEIIGATLAGKTGISTGNSPVDGVRRLLAYAPVGNTGWALVTGAPEGIILGGFRRTVWAFLIFVAVMLLLANLLAVFLARRFTQPIISIEEAAVSIGNGQLDTRVHVNSKDELQELAEEINRMAEELQITARSRADFLARVSHELRSPLTVIRSFLDLTNAGRLGDVPEPMHKGLDSALRQSQRLHQVIEDLIALSDLEARRVDLKKDVVDPTGMLNDAVGDLLPAAESKGLYLKLEMPGSLPRIRGDLVWLEDILRKVIDNAIKFTDKGGVTVTVGPSQGWLRIEISDTGTGIAAENLERIFERFYQVEDINIRHAQGSGLGLPIARLVIKLHGGSVWAESPGIGKGSTFIILLPACQ